jgi:hypothetical protein
VVANKFFARGTQIWFPFGPGLYGDGYPLNRQSADDFCNDRANNSPQIPDTASYDDAKFWDAFRTNKVPVWPPTDPKQAADVAEADRLNAIKARERRDAAERENAERIKLYEYNERERISNEQRMRASYLASDPNTRPSYDGREAAHKQMKQNSASSSPSTASPLIVSEGTVLKKDTEWIAGIENKYVIIGIIGLLFVLLIKRN